MLSGTKKGGAANIEKNLESNRINKTFRIQKLKYSNTGLGQDDSKDSKNGERKQGRDARVARIE